MRIWTLPFLLLFLGTAVALALLVILEGVPVWLSLVVLVAALVMCLVGGWLMRSRLMRVGFFLQALLIASGFLYLLPGVAPSVGATFLSYSIVSSITALLGVAVFICLSYGLAPWRTPRDLWLTILQVVLALVAAAFLVMRSFLVVLIPSYPNWVISLGFSLACNFFMFFLLLLRGVCWKRAPVAIALLVVNRLIQVVTISWSFLLYSFPSTGVLFSLTRVILVLERVEFPLFYLGLLVLIQTERVRKDQLPNPVLPPLPVPGSL